jgi:hypothetical protein
MGLHAIACFCLLLHAAPAFAQDPDDEGIWLSRRDAAVVLAKAALAETQAAELDALKRQVQLLKEIGALQEQLLAKADQVAAAETRLRELAESERDVYRGRAERLEHEGDKGRRWLQCRAWAGAGAILGSVAMPGVGMAAGAALGCVAGLLGAP